MSLQVWLPLNGSLVNQGVSNLTFSFNDTSTSPLTVSSSGKIVSQCYTNTTVSSRGISSNKTINLGSKLSMCCWFKFSSLTSASNLGCGLGG